MGSVFLPHFIKKKQLAPKTACAKKGLFICGEHTFDASDHRPLASYCARNRGNFSIIFQQVSYNFYQVKTAIPRNQPSLLFLALIKNTLPANTPLELGLLGEWRIVPCSTKTTTPCKLNVSSTSMSP